MKLMGRLYWDDVHCACMAHEWYALGTMVEYRKFVEDVAAHCTVNLAEGENACYALTAFADNIKRHSDIDYEVEDIAQVLLRKVTFYFVED